MSDKILSQVRIAGDGPGVFKSGLEEGFESFKQLKVCIDRNLSEGLREIEDFLDDRDEPMHGIGVVHFMRITVHKKVI